jgi:uncharacterized GH25 family protein
MKTKLFAALLVSAVAASPASAHRAWLLPSSTILSGDTAYVTVDAAVSNELFYFNHNPMRLDGLAISAPDGSKVDAENTSTGKYRSSFDVGIKADGTYRLALVSDGLTASYKVNGERKRWRGKPEDLAKDIPQGAEELKVTHAQRRLETFVTRGKPSELRTSGAGLEVETVTHPNDLISGEEASFKLLLDGKPAANVKVEVVPGGSRYRDKVGDFAVTTGADGSFKVKWGEPGMYYIEASVEDDKPGIKEATQRRATYGVTLEVMPE